MKAKKKFPVQILSGLFIAGVILYLSSCSSNGDDILNASDKLNVNNEATSGAFHDESSDMSTTAVSTMSSTQYTGARLEGAVISDTIKNIGLHDDRLKCAVVTVKRTGTKLSPAGTVLIDFGNGCTDSRGITRRGQIQITYHGFRFVPQSYLVIRHINFYRNDAHIEGVNTYTTQLSADSTHLQFVSLLDSGKVTFGGGKFVTRIHNLTREWYRPTINPLDFEWYTLEGGTASGLNKNGAQYVMQITKKLIHKIACIPSHVFVAVSGTKQITVTPITGVSRVYTVDYGDGACDNIVTVTIDGKSNPDTISADGN